MIPDDLRTGDDALDSQHLRVLVILNAIERETAPLGDLAVALGRHLAEHFRTEENFAADAGVDVRDHAREHLAFFDRFVHAKARLVKLGRGSSPEAVEVRATFASLVRLWVRDHVLRADVELVRSVKERRMSSPAPSGNGGNGRGCEP